MAKNQDESKSMDIHRLLLEASQKKRRERRAQLLQSIGVKEFFEEGKINVDMKTCKGVECKLCIKACPTNALYWKTGEIGITEDLCVYCTSCVLNCMVDDCIRVERIRSNGERECFSNPLHVLCLTDQVNTRNRRKAVESVMPDQESYLNRYRKPFFSTEQEK